MNGSMNELRLYYKVGDVGSPLQVPGNRNFDIESHLHLMKHSLL